VNDAVLTPLVFLHRFFSVEFLMANIAFKRSVVAMSSFMDPKVSLLSVLFATNFTGKWLLSGVSHQVALHGCYTDKPLAADCTYWQDLG
jgi:hypothetical protein